MYPPIHSLRFDLVQRLVPGRLARAVVLTVVALPLLASAVSAGGCGVCDDDGDGLTNEQEYAVYGTDLANADTDGDGMFDGYEVATGQDPFIPAGDPHVSPDGGGTIDLASCSYCDSGPTDQQWDQTCAFCDAGPGSTTYAEVDSDGDGLSDGYETGVSLTDPYNADTDGDRLSDSVEVHTTGTDPLRADSEGDGMPDYCDREPWVFNVDNESGADGALFGGGMGCSASH